MGEPPPKIHGGRAGLRALIVSYLKGKRTWLDKHGDVYEARDAARAREEAYEASLTEEQRERRGLAPLVAPSGKASSAADGRPVESVGTAARKGPPVAAPAPTPHEQAVNQLQSRIAFLGARIFSEPDTTKKAELMAQRADAERKLGELLDTGPPD
jgi:hypothetical protein